MGGGGAEVKLVRPGVGVANTGYQVHTLPRYACRLLQSSTTGDRLILVCTSGICAPVCGGRNCRFHIYVYLDGVDATPRAPRLDKTRCCRDNGIGHADSSNPESQQRIVKRIVRSLGAVAEPPTLNQFSYTLPSRVEGGAASG